MKWEGGGRETQPPPQVAGLKMGTPPYMMKTDASAPCIYVCRLYIATCIHISNTVPSTWIYSHKLPSLTRCQHEMCIYLCVYRDTFQDEKLCVCVSVYQLVPLLDYKFLEVGGYAAFTALSPGPCSKYLLKE